MVQGAEGTWEWLQGLQPPSSHSPAPPSASLQAASPASDASRSRSRERGTGTPGTTVKSEQLRLWGCQLCGTSEWVSGRYIRVCRLGCRFLPEREEEKEEGQTETEFNVQLEPGGGDEDGLDPDSGGSQPRQRTLQTKTDNQATTFRCNILVDCSLLSGAISVFEQNN